MNATATTGQRGALPARQVCWTRIGNRLGYTDTTAKRAEIQAAVDAMAWTEPDLLHDLLHAAPARFLIAGLLHDRHRTLHQAATTDLPDDRVGRVRHLFGLRTVDGDIYVLLSVGYEVIDILHETTVQPR